MKNCQGHTLIELLIAMSLSVVIITALMPLNTLGLKAADHQQKITLAVNQLQQSLKQLETDIKATGATSCLFDRNTIRDLVFTQPLSIKNQLNEPRLSGNQDGKLYPSSPFFDNSNISAESDAPHLMCIIKHRVQCS